MEHEGALLLETKLSQILKEDPFLFKGKGLDDTSLLLNLTDSKTFLLEVNSEGQAELSCSESYEATSEIKMKDATFYKLGHSKLNLSLALMTGKIKASGDLKVAAKVAQLIQKSLKA